MNLITKYSLAHPHDMETVQGHGFQDRRFADEDNLVLS